MMGPESRLKVSPDLLRMAEICVDMLHRSLEAFVTGNVELARSIPRDDDRVDELFNSIQSEIFQQMIANPKEIETINHLLWACHNLERLADRVTNICERTVFIATGDMLEFDRSDDERRKAFQGGL